jgi:hypothetical protein
MKRWCTSTWLAARPMPGAAYMVSNMSSIRRWKAAAVTSRDRPHRLGTQARVGEFENGEHGHGCFRDGGTARRQDVAAF